MKFIKYIDGHYIINLFGIIIRIKHYKKYNCPEPKEVGIQTNEQHIVVSLTSFPERINTVIKTIKTLLTQTIKPDVIVLWLAEEQFPNKEADLPAELLSLRDFGLTIGWYKDIRSYKKIIPALKVYPDSIIITTDDDIYYAPDTIESLYKSYLEYPNDIHAHRCDWVEINSTDNINSPIKWEKTRVLMQDKHRGISSYHNRLTGYGAVLYPPHSLYKDVTDENKISKTIPTHDDVWLWAMALLNRTKTRLVKGYTESINYIENSQQFGLCKTNKKGIGVPIEKAYTIIIKEYPEILDILKNY